MFRFMIDYSAAFDTESQLFLDEALADAGVPSKVRRIIQAIFSPVSFIPGLDRIFRRHDISTSGVTVGAGENAVCVSKLEYADDAALIDENVERHSRHCPTYGRIIAFPPT